MNDTYLYLIIALLPLTAGMLVTQTNPYHALIIRGVLGAVAAMVDAVLGAADVALTEALMGTMLSITLYAIAVRSSLVLRLGVMENQSIEKNQDSNFQQLINDFRSIFNKHYLRLELVPYPTQETLQQALVEKEIHATCALLDRVVEAEETYQTVIRVQRIYNIVESELSSPKTTLKYFNVLDSGKQTL
jgi:putative multicomponent Na+:H+ antiporter subunit B